MSRRGWPWVFVLVATHGANALAQGAPDEIARRRLIEEAEHARSVGDHAAALDFALRAGAVRMTPSVRQIIAYEHDAVGHTLEALDNADICEREAAADLTLHNRERLITACHALSVSLRARVGWLVVNAPAPLPSDLHVEVGGVTLPIALLGVERPLLPGAFTVTATSHGTAFQRETIIVAGAHQSVDIALIAPPSTPTVTAPSVATPAATAPSAPSVTPTPLVVAPVRTVTTSAPVAPWIVVGVGGASLALAGVFALLREDARASRDAGCDRDGCAPEARDDNASFERYTVLTDVALGVGAAALIGGVTWYALARRGSSAQSRVAASIAPSPSGASLTLSGAF